LLLRARVRAKTAREREGERKRCQRDDSGGGTSPSFPQRYASWRGV